MEIRHQKKTARQQYSQIIQKKLNDDFQVYELLNQSHYECKNIEDYASLLNQLLLTKSMRLKYYHTLIAKLKALNRQQQREQVIQNQLKSWGGLKQHFINEYETVENNIANQGKIKQYLWKDIIQIRKSLNLLKGDIGHIVGRNQSAKLLSSKISKVNIVADDQLKRVSVALGKDRQEIVIRDKMQKKFGKHLKYISNTQTASLKNMKKNYIESTKKQRDLNNRLNNIEKMTSSIEQRTYIQRKKNSNNQKIVQYYQYLQQAQLIINGFAQLEQKQGIKVQMTKQREDRLIDELKQGVTKFEKDNLDGQDIKMINSERIQELEHLIVGQYHRLSNQINLRSKNYLVIMQKDQQYLQNLQKLNHLSHPLPSYHSIPQSSTHFHSFWKYKNTLNIIFQFLLFLNQNISTNLQKPIFYDPSNHNQFNHSNLTNRKPYVSQLLNNYQFLLLNKEENKQMLLQQDFFGELKKDLKQWMKCLNNEVKKGKMRQNHLKDHFSTLNNRTKDHAQKQSQASSSSLQKQQQPKQRDLNLRSSNSSSKKHQIHTGKTTDHKQNIPNAKRMQLLNDIDQNYYKMLKSTLKMQQENTRKNYLFLRTFKRSKYSTRDQILEEKRFESSFSVLFSQKQLRQHTNRIQKQKEVKHSSEWNNNSLPSKNFRSLHQSRTIGVDSLKKTKKSSTQLREARLKKICKQKLQMILK